jgi:hypothetical protein
MGAQEGLNRLSSAAEILQEKFSQVIGWERRKQTEQILVTLLCYSLFFALVTLPFHRLLPVANSRWFVPISFFVLLAPFVFFRRRWRPSDSARALARVDHALNLDERAVTAWELLERHETRGAALLVLKEAAEKLKTLNPKMLFRRSWSWQACLAVPLLILWLGLLWFDVGLQFENGAQHLTPKTMAQSLREFARDLQEKAKDGGLQESLKMGRELEQVAQKGIDAKTDDNKFKAELAGMTKKVETMGKSAAKPESLSAAESQQDLKDLKTELEAAPDLLNIPDVAKGTQELGKQWLDRLATLPQLKRQFELQNQAGQSLSQNELKSFLDKLEKQTTGELDRRTLLEAQQFLEQLMKQGEGKKGESDMRMAGHGEQNLPDDGERTNNKSALPGKEPGKREEGSRSLPEFQAGASAQIKGLLGEGNSSGLVFKAKPSAGKSEVSQEEVIASYRRQAEAELNTERVPDALKDTIKNYFLSLGIGEGAK